jgi:hypothetical protein
MKTVLTAGFGLAMAFGGGVWAASGWKTGVDDHLDRMEKHIDYQDGLQKIEEKQLQWLIEHNKDANQAPMDWTDQRGESISPYEDVSQAPQNSERSRMRGDQ